MEQALGILAAGPDFPRFQAEFPEIFQQIGGDIRNQYSIAIIPRTPSSMALTAKCLKVEVVAPDGGPLED